MNPGTDLEQVAAEAAARLAGAPAEEVLGWAWQTFGTRLAVATSFSDTVLAHLAGRVAPGVDVLFLDTGYHFPETLGTRDAAAATYPVRVRSVTPERSVAEQDRDLGPRLYARDPDRCCALRKVAPLEQALRGYAAWASGVRGEESPTRATAREVEWDARRGMVKVNPLVGWTQDDVDAYVAAHGLLSNPLVDEGYASVGCAPCTRPVAPGAGARSGRWAGLAKTECGIHT